MCIAGTGDLWMGGWSSWERKAGDEALMDSLQFVQHAKAALLHIVPTLHPAQTWRVVC